MNDKYKNVHYISILNDCHPFYNFIPNFIKEKHMGTEIEFMDCNDTTGFTYLFDNPATGKREYLGFTDSYIFDIINNNKIIFDPDWINHIATNLDKINTKLKHAYIETVQATHQELRKKQKELLLKGFDEQTRKIKNLITSIDLDMYDEAKSYIDAEPDEYVAE